jgi:hypothetical protein
MRTLYRCLLLLSMVAVPLPAQFIYKVALGVGVHPKFGINAGEIPQGVKTDVAFTGVPDIWLQGVLPLDRYGDITARLDIGYMSHAFGTKTGDPDSLNDRTTFTQHYRYVGIVPSLSLSVLNLGLGIGIPLGATVENKRGDVSRELSASDVGTLVEIRLGISAPLVKDPKSGQLSFQLFAAYGLSGLPVESYELAREAFVGRDRPPTESRFAPKVASLAVGLSYHFFLGVERATVE